jgi:hypothetical protein
MSSGAVFQQPASGSRLDFAKLVASCQFLVHTKS